MRFNIHHEGCSPRFAGRGRSFSFGPGGFHFDFGDEEGGDWGGGRRGRRSGKRMFEGGELRLVLLKLIADEPRHGYELIKAVEDMTSGDYAPSPGIVYPTLTMLEDIGYIAERKSKDSKKIYEATEEGRIHLEENSEEVDELIERLEGHGRRRSRGQRPEIGRAIGNLMAALRHRIASEGWNEDLLEEVIDVLDDAAQRIERAKKRSRDSSED
ncbi:PadR family transcriptional regulator [Sphingomonas sp. HDW15A]|uniref:PadR family transcriptional regulator n=1 Tax=Sphingomonas sp. HDW15A TaxID=2714942 RepID=UPI00140ADD85|nr:PadR family transcriptional regulator [Sphingomonas sp. HDW15A]QIK95348.1 PadR family transcriptional regulator [Sphingomonas sp. HDW15A]